MEYSDHGSTGTPQSGRYGGNSTGGSMSAPRASYSGYRDDVSPPGSRRTSTGGNAPVWASSQPETFQDEDHFSYSPVAIPKPGGGSTSGGTIVGSFRPALEDMVDVNVSGHGKSLLHKDSDGVFRNGNRNSNRRSSILGMDFDDLGLETTGMKRRTVYLGVACGLLVVLVLLIGALVGTMSGRSVSSASKPATSTVVGNHQDNPWLDETITPSDCDFSNILQPDVFLQCRCIGRISIFSEQVLRKYTELKNDFIIKHVIPDFHHKIDSCEPANVALAWLSSDEYPHEREMHDRYMLALLYAAWRGFAWTRQDNWLLTSSSHCEWHGIGCDTHNRTIEVLLNDNNLEGGIPSEIVKMDSLSTLSITDNLIEGRIPRQFGEWRSMQTLRMSGNNLFFTIPTELGYMENLEDLELDHNSLAGPIPTELMRLPLLDYVGLWNNKLTGRIPTEVGSLKKCREFKVNANSLTGTIPTEIGNMEMLRVWESARNACEGGFPSEIGKLTNLVAFDVSSMGLVGTVPNEVEKLTSMETFAIADNFLGGPFPMGLTEMTSMEFLFMNNNGFVGPIPSGISKLRELKQLFLQNNNLSGTVPKELAFCKELTTIDFSSNKLDGAMPAEVCGLREQNLQSLVADCEKQQIECPFPDCCSGCVP